MPSRIYSHLAPVYPHLMRSIDYSLWSDFIHSISREIKRKRISVLELACGNGLIAGTLNKKFKYYCATDLSKEMLACFGGVDKVCCDMLALPFKKQFDFIFSTFDSVNYLTSRQRFIRMLNQAALCLARDGIFTFDVSLENNSKLYQKYLNRKGTYNGMKFLQKSYYDEAKRIHYNYFELTLANGSKVEEIHKQKIFRFEDYFSFIDDSDFYVYKCKKAFSEQDASPDSERAQFILKKRRG
ncbi:MAG TPA: class I SAM-dependent methyltransferase [Melioribacteraceae bacterium]|nr:class I SAM-dependent methyltransferase [Melioribacteraceae bacterium]